MMELVATGVLQKIGLQVQGRISKLKREVTQDELLKLWQGAGRSINPFISAFPKGEINVIAEVKRASPSQGDIFLECDPVAVAEDYRKNGAKAISVLTEPDFFKGDVEYLKSIRRAMPKMPLLMKDFFVDEYQLYQALAYGADAILIIVALLGKDQSAYLYQKASDFGLQPLVEVHDDDELQHAQHGHRSRDQQ